MVTFHLQFKIDFIEFPLRQIYFSRNKLQIHSDTSKMKPRRSECVDMLIEWLPWTFDDGHGSLFRGNDIQNKTIAINFGYAEVDETLN